MDFPSSWLLPGLVNANRMQYRSFNDNFTWIVGSVAGCSRDWSQRCCGCGGPQGLITEPLDRGIVLSADDCPRPTASLALSFKTFFLASAIVQNKRPLSLSARDFTYCSAESLNYYCVPSSPLHLVDFLRKLAISVVVFQWMVTNYHRAVFWIEF